jgi:epsilon-lactone hydrolase
MGHGITAYRTKSLDNRYGQRDVIFHLTGGGFFAHIIASNLLYLLDWRASTGAVVICPEYSLLPEHAFPDALNELTQVYHALRVNKDCDIASALGFEVNRIIITGESTGGSLAAALCVKLIQEHQSLALPNALMLSSAVLNLSLELTYSRLQGTQDTVLPSGLLSVISNEYLPASQSDGIDKTNPVVSPIFANDDILIEFPPTLLFASSNDLLVRCSIKIESSSASTPLIFGIRYSRFSGSTANSAGML